MRNTILALCLLFTFMGHAWATDERHELEIQQLSDSVYLHISYKFVDGFGLVDSNGLVVIVANDAYIVDTPWSAEDTEQLLKWIKAKGYIVKASVSSHFHEDRTAGIEYLNAKAIPTYASKQTNELLKKAGHALAQYPFDGDVFWLLNDKIEVYYPGAGHAKDNVVVWLPVQKILFGGCLIRAKETTTLGNTSDAVISAWSASVAKLQSHYGDAKLVIPGHGNIGSVSLLEHTRKLAKERMASEK